MKRGIGKALETGMGPYRFLPEDVPEKEKSLLSSERRLAILVYLLNYPCAPLSRISEEMHISLGSIRWHLGILRNGDIVERTGRRYFVSGAILPEHTAMFGLLHNRIERKISEIVIKRGPLRAVEIKRVLKISPQLLRYHIKRLENTGILEKLGGLYELAFDLMEFQRIYWDLIERSLAKLAMNARLEGVSMEIERTSHGFLLHVSSPIEVHLEVYEVPFYEVLG